MSFIILVIIVLLLRGSWNSYVTDREIKGRQVKQCNVCNMTIPYGSTKCPYCHCNPGSDLKADVDTFGDRFALFCGNVIKGFIFLIILCLLLSAL